MAAMRSTAPPASFGGRGERERGSVAGLPPRGVMTNLLRPLVRFLKKEDGPTAVEYAVMLALIIVVCLVAITALGTQTSQTFSTVTDRLQVAS